MSSLTRRERLEAMLADEPNDAELRYMLAMEHASTGDDAGAALVFEALLGHSPDYPPAYHQGARTLARLDRSADACALLERGIPVALRLNDAHTAGEMQQFLEMLKAG